MDGWTEFYHAGTLLLPMLVIPTLTTAGTVKDSFERSLPKEVFDLHQIYLPSLQKIINSNFDLFVLSTLLQKRLGPHI